MSNKPRYVFDTNTIVSAFLFHQHKPGLALRRAIDEGEILLSLDVAEELAEVLRREKFDRYIAPERREELLQGLLHEAVFIEITETIRACRDAKDDKFLELAVAGGAACLVTGDADLLVLHPFRSIPVLRPTEFLNWVVAP